MELSACVSMPPGLVSQSRCSASVAFKFLAIRCQQCEEHCSLRQRRKCYIWHLVSWRFIQKNLPKGINILDLWSQSACCISVADIRPASRQSLVLMLKFYKCFFRMDFNPSLAFSSVYVYVTHVCLERAVESCEPVVVQTVVCLLEKRQVPFNTKLSLKPSFSSETGPHVPGAGVRLAALAREALNF